jgi:hypothetical protein
VIFEPGDSRSSPLLLRVKSYCTALSQGICAHSVPRLAPRFTTTDSQMAEQRPLATRGRTKGREPFHS